MNVLERMKENDTERKIADFKAKQHQPYDFKVAYAETRVWEFLKECGKRELNCHVSVGGLDSITLCYFLKHLNLNLPMVSASSLEDKSIQAIHKQLGVINVKPIKNKVAVIKEFGYPILSKEIANKISLLQRPSEDNKTVRHAIITGETGEYGGNRTGTRMKLSQQWLELFGGYENEAENCKLSLP